MIRALGRPPVACGTNRTLPSGRQLGSWRSLSVSFRDGMNSWRSPPCDDTRKRPPSPLPRTIFPSGHHEALLPPPSCFWMSAIIALSPPPPPPLPPLSPPPPPREGGGGGA